MIRIPGCFYLRYPPRNGLERRTQIEGNYFLTKTKNDFCVRFESNDKKEFQLTKQQGQEIKDEYEKSRA